MCYDMKRERERERAILQTLQMRRREISQSIGGRQLAVHDGVNVLRIKRKTQGSSLLQKHFKQEQQQTREVGGGS